MKKPLNPLPKLICIILVCLLHFSKGIAQCGVLGIPYEHTFNSGSNLNCWNFTSGTTNINHTNILSFNQDTAVGTAILISPEIYISRNAYLNYSWSHRIDNTNVLGAQDSLNVFIKRSTDNVWSILKRHSAPFKSGVDLYNFLFEDLSISSPYVGDTVQIKFEYYTLGVFATPLHLDNFRIVPDNSDSIFTIPYYESFDGQTWRPDSSIYWFFNYFKIDSNWRAVPWENNDVNSFKWVVGDDSTYSSGTGPLTDFSGNGNYLYSEASGSPINDAIVYTPYIDFDTTHSFIQLGFWYHMRGETMGTLLIEQRLGQNWAVLDSISGEQQKSITDPWKKFEVLADSAQLTQFRFRMKKNTSGPSNLQFTQDAAIDNLSLTPVSCPVPNNFSLTFSTIGTNQAQVDWNAGPIANNYIIEYDTTGFPIGTGLIDTVSSNTFFINNLQVQTTYDVYVRFLCGSGDTSSLRGPYSFTTPCAAVGAPYVENFNDTLIPECWTTHNQLGLDFPNAAWKPTESGGSGNLTFPAYGAIGQNDHTGNNGFAIGVDGSAPFPLDSIAIYSPFIDVSALLQPELSMWIYSNNTNFPGENNTFYMDVFDGIQWHYSVLTYANDSADWVELKVDLKQFNAVDPIRIRLVVDKDSMNAAFYNDIVIDDFSVTDAYGTACPIPSNLSILDKGCDSVTISWNSDSANITSRIKYGPIGFDHISGGTVINNVSSPYTLNNLQVGEAYDLYVIDSCLDGIGISDTSFSTDSTLLPILNYTADFHSTFGNFSVFLFDARATIDGNSYLWDFGNGNTAQGDTIFRTYYQNGTYPVRLTVTNACGSVTDSFNLVINNISLEENSFFKNIKVFPNPSDGNLKIEFNGLNQQGIQLELWSPLGSKVWEQHLVPNMPKYTLYVSLPELSPGIYLLNVKGERGERTSKRLLIE